MNASKRPSTSSLRRFISSRAYVPVAELRRRFGLDDPDAMSRLQRNGTVAFIGLPDREAAKLGELWNRDEIGLELSVEVRAPVAIGIYPMRISRYGYEPAANGHAHQGLRPLGYPEAIGLLAQTPPARDPDGATTAAATGSNGPNAASK
ncbi:MAG: hypothetical protein DLM71_07445 [Chloroflexi bacterium]|nr:MAG: hypothetical protein DLM71_07445 [Chloroflexota bacterium]